MDQCDKRKKFEFAGSMFLSALLFLVIYKFVPVVYSTNDDRMIAEIVSGQFTGTPESYGIQMTYGFTWLLSRLYLITRKLNWYGIVLLSSQIFAFGTVLYRLQRLSQKSLEKVAILLSAIGIYLLLWLKVYVQMTYTTTAAFVGMAAMVWYALSKTDGKNILMTGILANLAFSIRPNIFYMLLPATGLIYLWKLIGKKDVKKLTIASPFMILAVTLCLFVVNAAAYSQGDWKEFKQFFDARTKVYDYYQLADYEQCPELYEPYGITEEEYNLLKVYDYTILDDLPKDFFPKYIEAYQKWEKENGVSFFSKAKNAVLTFGSDLCSNEYGLKNSSLFLCSLLLLLILIRKRNYQLAGYLGIQTAALCVLWLYFTYWGRAIERIQMSMSLIHLAVLLHVLYEWRIVGIQSVAEEKEICADTKKVSNKKGHKMWKNAFKSLVFVSIFLAAAKNLTECRSDNIEKAYHYADAETIKEYCAEEPDRLYFMDIATMTELYGRFSFKNTEPEYLNYISLGDWTAYCPHYEKKLQNHGVIQVAEAITEDRTYVVMLHNYQLKCLKEYLDVEETWTETIFGAGEVPYAVYQFEDKQ